MLSIEGINAGYGATTILTDVSLSVAAGEVVTIVGANGAGKTTTLRTIAGLLTPTAGRITFEGQDITRLSAHEVVELGITLIPEGRQLFPDMTVRENLLMGAYRKGARARQADTLDEVLTLGWAYGDGGQQLRGKDLWLVTSTGGTEAAYSPRGYNRYFFDAFLPPYEQTAALCGLRFLPPLVLHGAHQASQDELDTHVATYVQRLNSYPDWPEILEMPECALCEVPTQDRPVDPEQEP